jgi:hypothetical protein
VASDAIASIRANTSSDELNAVWAEAKVLGAWFRDFVDDFKGKPLPASAADRLQLLNGILARDAQIEQIDIRDNLNDRIAGSGLRRSTRRIWRSADMLLLPIARAMAELICTADFSSIRVCDGPGCGTVFLDRMREQTLRRCRTGTLRPVEILLPSVTRQPPRPNIRQQEPRCAARIDPRSRDRFAERGPCKQNEKQ